MSHCSEPSEWEGGQDRESQETCLSRKPFEGRQEEYCGIYRPSRSVFLSPYDIKSKKITPHGHLHCSWNFFGTGSYFHSQCGTGYRHDFYRRIPPRCLGRFFDRPSDRSSVLPTQSFGYGSTPTFYRPSFFHESGWMYGRPTWKTENSDARSVLSRTRHGRLFLNPDFCRADHFVVCSSCGFFSQKPCRKFCFWAGILSSPHPQQYSNFSHGCSDPSESGCSFGLVFELFPGEKSNMKRTLRTLLSMIIAPFCFLFAEQYPDTLFSPITLDIREAQIKNYRYLGDLINSMPGVWIRDMGTTGQWTSTRFRGANENQTVFLLDGCPLTEPWSGIYDLNLLPTEMIQKIEIYPSLNPYGVSPIGGTVNIVSRTIPTRRPYTKVVYRTGKNNYSDLDVSFGRKLSPKWSIFSGVLLKKYGDHLPYQKYSSQKVRSKITCSPSSGVELSYAVLHTKSDVNLPYPFQIPGDTLVLSNSHRKTSDFHHTLKADFHLWKISTSFFVNHNSHVYEFQKMDLHSTESFPVKTTSIALRQGIEKYPIPLSWGIQTTVREFKESHNHRYRDTVTQSFLLGKILLSKKLVPIVQLSLHVSPDNTIRFLKATQWTWKFGSGFALRTSYAESLRDPSLGEMRGYPFYPTVPTSYDQLTNQSLIPIPFGSHDGEGQNLPMSYAFSSSIYHILPNPNLKSEAGQTLETGLQWTAHGRFQIQIVGYIRKTHNLIQIAISQGDAQFTNSAKALFSGLETDVQVGPWHGFRVSFTLNLLKTSDTEELPERPSLWGTHRLIWEHSLFQGDLDVRLCLCQRYWTKFLSLASSTPETSDPLGIPSGSVLDFKASFGLIKNALFTFAVDNILSTETSLVYGFFLPKRLTRIGFSWELFD